MDYWQKSYLMLEEGFSQQRKSLGKAFRPLVTKNQPYPTLRLDPVLQQRLLWYLTLDALRPGDTTVYFGELTAYERDPDNAFLSLKPDGTVFIGMSVKDDINDGVLGFGVLLRNRVP